MDGHGHRMLLVEDSEGTRLALRRIFARRGWEVIEAATIAKGVAILDHSDPPDCLILDMDLPDGRGDTILRKVRDERLPTRVVVHSGTQDEALLRELEALRPDAVLPKPADPDRLCRACGVVTA
ncbi:response regulator [Tautonia plasticadhaerens]|uniref:Sporulation initiation phosphotransferase F n=1 Tax=Tautonia plasticadhaerens TaxID=2527974 RepID=A0A518HET6_9BACT|nr:response regulator [Tautonia plasticadhaerens]QDV39286.1 Sporulation initiation phosphotransferase F [Tautonia plasticadhaerens]